MGMRQSENRSRSRRSAMVKISRDFKQERDVPGAKHQGQEDQVVRRLVGRFFLLLICLVSTG
jgi:hypothetical protein